MHNEPREPDDIGVCCPRCRFWFWASDGAPIHNEPDDENQATLPLDANATDGEEEPKVPTREPPPCS